MAARDGRERRDAARLLSTVDGVLGTDVLAKFNIDLDLPNRRMSLYEKGHMHAGMGRSRYRNQDRPICRQWPFVLSGPA